MKLCLILMFCSFSAFATEKKRPECQDVYRIIANAGRGFVYFHTELDFSPSSAIAAAELCVLEKMIAEKKVNPGEVFEVRRDLLKQLIAASEEAFKIGETTKDIVEGLKDRLEVLERECGSQL